MGQYNKGTGKGQDKSLSITLDKLIDQLMSAFQRGNGNFAMANN